MKMKPYKISPASKTQSWKTARCDVTQGTDISPRAMATPTAVVLTPPSPATRSKRQEQDQEMQQETLERLFPSAQDRGSFFFLLRLPQKCQLMDAS